MLLLSMMLLQAQAVPGKPFSLSSEVSISARNSKPRGRDLSAAIGEPVGQLDRTGSLELGRSVGEANFATIAPVKR